VPILAQYLTGEGATLVQFDQPLATPGGLNLVTFKTTVPPDVFRATTITLVAPDTVKLTNTPNGAEGLEPVLDYSASLHTIKGANGLDAPSFFGFPLEIV
jgi:hypothetical protein